MSSGVALVFPGQGSQRPGMAAAWRDHPAWARWTEASEVLGRDVTRLGLDADADELRDPETCQLALYVHHAVLLDAWRDAGGEASVTAGHSLGEYDALLAASVLSFADGLRLVAARAQATKVAAEASPGTMIACVGYDEGVVEDACVRAGASVANDNAPGQVVIAGSGAALEAVREALADASGRGRILDVDVGAAYHSPAMAPAAEALTPVLAAAEFATADIPVVANADARAHTAAGDWPTLLAEQVRRPVRWRESVATIAQHADELIELCAAPVLGGMVKRIDRSLTRRAVSNPENL